MVRELGPGPLRIYFRVHPKDLELTGRYVYKILLFNRCDIWVQHEWNDKLTMSLMKIRNMYSDKTTKGSNQSWTGLDFQQRRDLEHDAWSPPHS